MTGFDTILATEQKLLSVFLLHPFQEQYAKQIETNQTQPNPLSHERVLTHLKELSRQHILLESRKGKQVFYKLNPNHPALTALMGLVEQNRQRQFYQQRPKDTAFLDSMIDHSTKNLRFDLLFVVLFGSQARHQDTEESDWDFLCVVNKLSSTRKKKIEALLNNASRLRNRNSSIQIFSVKEVAKHWHSEPIYSGLFRDRVVLYGHENFWKFVLQKGEPSNG